MKTLFISIIALFITTAVFSQAPGSDSARIAYQAYACPMHPEYVSRTAGKCPVCHMAMTAAKTDPKKAGKTKLYSCPMHADVISTKKGKCPVCEMDLTAFQPKEK
ncbi:MAG TPA: heavy metal-binding domain-containing protein [Sediminibacterium sp.]|nr:heavy metal-binding domain-containing protein [Sediminibacterium sp.]